MSTIAKRTRTVKLYGGDVEARISELEAALDEALYDEAQSGDARMSTKSPVGKLAKELDAYVASADATVLVLTELPRQRVRDITDDCPPREGKWLDRLNGMDYDKYIRALFVAMLTSPEWSEAERGAFFDDLGQAGYDKVRTAIEEITSTEVDVPKYSAASVVNQARENMRQRRSSTG